MSKKTLIKFAKLVKDDTTLFTPDGGFEDVRMGRALGHSAIFVDSRDEMKQERFFPMSLLHFLEKSYLPIKWFNKSRYFEYIQGSKCCSDVGISFHYIDAKELYKLEYFIYNVHPFGVEKNLTETLPRKLSLDEIIAASDAKSSASDSQNHTDYHNMTSSEMF